MSTTPLTTIQDVIERSLFQDIRQELVDKGYLPDISDTVTYPDTQVGWDQWETDIAAIVTSKGFAIELFSGGSNASKGIKKVPRIVMESGSFLPGALGGDPRRFFNDLATHYEALVTPPQTVDFYMNFCLVSNSIAQARILNAIIALAVPRRGYIPWYNDATKTFFARNINYYDRTDEDQGIIEHVWAYEIPDAWDHDDIDYIIPGALPGAPGSTNIIAKISEITLNTNIQKYMDGSWGYNTDPLVMKKLIVHDSFHGHTADNIVLV